MSEERVVIITGAAGGIGKAMALQFARQGFSLALVDIDRIKLKELKTAIASLSSNVLLISGDLSSAKFVESITPLVVKKWGRIDVLINNAAWRNRQTLRTISRSDWDKTLRVCLTAPAFLTKYVAAVMERLCIRGAIINISSIQSQLAGGASPAYTVCKGGIESLTYESAVLYGPKGIRVIAVRPGNIQTSLSNDISSDDRENISAAFTYQAIDNTPLRKIGSAAEIALVVSWLCSEAASFITGTTITADGGYSANFISYSLKKKQLKEEF